MKFGKNRNLSLNILILCDVFFKNNSAAIQLNDLANEFVKQGHEVTILTTFDRKAEIKKKSNFNYKQFNFNVISVPFSKKDINFIRLFFEILLPFHMLIGYFFSNKNKKKWDYLIWYSPTIFLGPCVLYFKLKKIKTYLILRDIFPEWAVDLGLIRFKPLIIFLKIVAKFQYYLADTIGVQTKGNLDYFNQRLRNNKNVQVLENWLSQKDYSEKILDFKDINFYKNKVFIYSGNMGVAQHMNILILLAKELKQHRDISFLLIGNGSEKEALKNMVIDLDLDNIFIYDEVEPNILNDIYNKCFAGIVLLDLRHKSHNIPGKFISYMRAGLPILANINVNNDLAETIKHYSVGEVCSTLDAKILKKHCLNLIKTVKNDKKISLRCTKLFDDRFCASKACKKIIDAYKG